MQLKVFIWGVPTEITDDETRAELEQLNFDIELIDFW